MFSTDSQIGLNPGATSDVISSSITYWDLFAGQPDTLNLAQSSLRALVFGLPNKDKGPHQLCSTIKWSRPVRTQQGIVRQCVSLETSSPDFPLPIVVITLIENGLMKVVVAEDQVPRVLLSNDCAHAFQFGQCPSPQDKQNVGKTGLSGRDLVVSENLETYTKLLRLNSRCRTFYEPPELRESFLTKKPQSMPKLRVQFLKQVNIKELPTTDMDEAVDRMIDLPQGWSEPIDISNVGIKAYDLPGNYRLHVEVVKKTSFLTHVTFKDTFNEVENRFETSLELSETEVISSFIAYCLFICLFMFMFMFTFTFIYLLI